MNSLTGANEYPVVFLGKITPVSDCRTFIVTGMFDRHSICDDCMRWSRQMKIDIPLKIPGSVDCKCGFMANSFPMCNL